MDLSKMNSDNLICRWLYEHSIPADVVESFKGIATEPGWLPPLIDKVVISLSCSCCNYYIAHSKKYV